MTPRVAIVGAGWAGLSAAVALAPSAEVVLFEAGKVAGGRARRVELDGMALDNGQHILIGAYRDTLQLLRTVGVDPAAQLAAQPLAWLQVDGMRMRCPDWPAPLHLLAGLLTARGLRWRDKLAMLRLLTWLRWQGWKIGQDAPALAWLAAHGQSEALLQRFWTPLILATLNTPPAQASMQLLVNVLRDSLGAASADASRLLLPRCDLGRLLVDPALQWLAARGTDIRLGHRVAALAPQPEGGWQVDGERFDAVVVAVAPYHAAALLHHAPLQALLKGWQYQPISTVYLQFEGKVRLPAVMTGQAYGSGQWWFDRQALSGEPGLVSVVISAQGAHDTLTRDALREQLLAEMRRHVPDLPPLKASWQITEQRATFAANVGLPRPDVRLGVESAYLAGDWLCADYPATLEGAVRSGMVAARTLMQDWTKKNDGNFR